MASCWIGVAVFEDSSLPTATYESRRRRDATEPSSGERRERSSSDEPDRLLFPGLVGDWLSSEDEEEGECWPRGWPFSGEDRAKLRSSQLGCGAFCSCGGSGVGRRTWMDSPVMPFIPFGLRGEGGDVLPFTAVKAGTRGSPELFSCMNLGLLIKGACTTAGIVGSQRRWRRGQPRRLLSLRGIARGLAAASDRYDVSGYHRIATVAEAVPTRRGLVSQTGVGVSLKCCDTATRWFPGVPQCREAAFALRAGSRGAPGEKGRTAQR